LQARRSSVRNSWATGREMAATELNRRRPDSLRLPNGPTDRAGVYTVPRDRRVPQSIGGRACHRLARLRRKMTRGPLQPQGALTRIRGALLAWGKHWSRGCTWSAPNLLRGGEPKSQRPAHCGVSHHGPDSRRLASPSEIEPRVSWRGQRVPSAVDTLYRAYRRGSQRATRLLYAPPERRTSQTIAGELPATSGQTGLLDGHSRTRPRRRGGRARQVAAARPSKLCSSVPLLRVRPTPGAKLRPSRKSAPSSAKSRSTRALVKLAGPSAGSSRRTVLNSRAPQVVQLGAMHQRFRAARWTMPRKGFISQR